MPVTETAINQHARSRTVLSNTIKRLHRDTEYTNGTDTLSWTKQIYAKHHGIIDFAMQIGAITFTEAMECHAVNRDILDFNERMIKAHRLPIAERDAALGHLQSHSGAAIAARVSTLLSILAY